MTLFSGCNGSNPPPAPQKPAVREDPWPQFECRTQEAESPPIVQPGEKTTASNGVTVAVRDIFQPSDPISPDDFITCYEFSIGSHALHPHPICVRDYKSSRLGESVCSFRFSDFGVSLVHWPATEAGIPLLVEAKTGPIQDQEDLFEACRDEGHDVRNCYLYTHTSPLSYEDVSIHSGYMTFFPPDEALIGNYMAVQWPRCRSDAQALLAPETPLPSGGYLRAHFDSGNELSFVGLAIPTESVLFNFIKSMRNALAHNLGEYQPSDSTLCMDPILYHESAHLVWGRTTSPFAFWMPLQEGAARYMELHPPDRPRPKTYADVFVAVDNPLDVVLADEGDDFQLRVLLEDVTTAGMEIVIEITKNNASQTTKSSSKVFVLAEDPQSIDLGHGYSLLADASLHLQLVRVNYNGMQNGLMRLSCGADTYRVDLGIWMDDTFYSDMTPPDNVSWFGVDQPYVALNGFNGKQSEYFTGACFFDGIERLYADHGADFGTFFPQLTTAVQAFGDEPLPVQYHSGFCALETFQAIVDADLGPSALDVTDYAAHFGHDSSMPWCSGPKPLYNSDRFGQWPSWY